MVKPGITDKFSVIHCCASCQHCDHTLDIYHIPSRTSVQPCDPVALSDAYWESPSVDNCPICLDSWEEIFYRGSVHESHGWGFYWKVLRTGTSPLLTVDIRPYRAESSCHRWLSQASMWEFQICKEFIHMVANEITHQSHPPTYPVLKIN
jgi:hypothetical protein